MDYTVVKAVSPEDKTRVQQFLNEHFFPDNPLTSVFGLEGLPPPPLSQVLAQDELEGFCLMAVDSRGGVVGIAVNRMSDDHDVEWDVPPEVKKVIEFMEWVEREARLETLPERTVELGVLAVHREWRRRGLARRLAEESVRHARECGLQALRVCCTSEYTARLARSLGWRQHYCLRYQDYAPLALHPPPPPHQCVYYYVTEL